MTRHTVRKERTLWAESASSQDVQTLDTTIIDLPLPSLKDSTASFEAIPDARTRVERMPEEKASPERDIRSLPEARGRAWLDVLKTSVKALLWIAVFPFLGILPFIVVLRISVVAYKENTLAGWESLGIGMIAAVLLVCVFIAVFIRTFRIRRRFFMPLLNVCLTAMLCYSGYALFYLAANHAKTEEIRTYYTTLHPFLRIAVKNLTLVDDDLVITDAQRTKKDYRNMGLSARNQSLHFRQPTGYVHAVDVRTNGRSKLTNLLVELYFILMGFETLRHVGTADHLHVSLPYVNVETLAASGAPKETG